METGVFMCLRKEVGIPIRLKYHNLFNKGWFNMKTNNYNWILKEKISKKLKDEDIKTIINKKLASLIIELEINEPIYLKDNRVGQYEY